MQTQALPYDNIPQLLQVLRETFAGDNESVKRATEVLQAMANDPIRFIDVMSKIITIERSDEEALKAKNAASVGMSRCLLEKMKENKLSVEYRNYAIRAVISAMFSEYVTLPMKVNLQYFLLLLYTVDEGYQMTNEGLALVKQKFATSNVHNYPPAFLILQAIINTAQAPQEKISRWFEELRDLLLNIGGGLARGIMMEVQDISANPTQEKIQSVFVGLKIFKMWVLTLQEFIKLLGQNNPKLNTTATYLKVIIIQENFVQILSAMLMLNFQTDKQIKDCIFSTSGYLEVDNIINNVKTSALKSFNRVIDLMKELSVVVNPIENKFFLFSRNYGVSILLKSIVVFFRHESLNLEAFLNDRDLSELVSEAIGFLTRMASYQDLYPTYAGFIKHLVVDVCFSLIKTTAGEIDNFKSNPEQFVALGIDTIGEKSSNTPKTQAAKFLNKLCLSIDGALSYVALITLCMIDYSMVSDKREEIPNTHKDLTEYVNSIIIAKTDPTIRVETCLLVLTVLSAPIGKRKDLVPMIEKLLLTYSPFFLGNESNPIIKARVCLLFSTYSQILFRNETQVDHYTAHLRFLLECAGLEAQDESFDALVEQANNSLYTMFEKEFLQTTLTPYVADFLERLTAFILYNKTTKTFDIIHEIVTSYDFEVLKKPELLLNLAEALVKRWQYEFAQTHKDAKSKKIVLNKIWNVIRGIAAKEEYVTALQDDFETILMPMFAYLEIPENLDFDEDILNYIASVTKITKRVSPAIWEVFRKFPKIFERYKGVLSHLIQPLNQIIVHGASVINQDQSAIETIINMGIDALTPSHHSADEASYSEGAVLLQLAFQYLEPIQTNLFERILSNCYQKLQSAHQSFLKARLGGVFLCAFLKDFERTQITLNNMQVIKPLMDLFLDDLLVFETHSYDRKLLLLGLSSLLPHVNISPDISSRYPQIFDIIISLLRYVRHMEQKEAKQGVVRAFIDSDEEEERKASDQNVLMDFLKGKPKLNQEIDEMDDDDISDDEDTSFVMGKSEANNVIRNLETALKQQDEFNFFKQAVFKMKESKPDILMALVETLPKQKNDFLKDVMQSQRITTNEAEGASQARKIVKAGAKKVAQIHFKGGNFANL